MKKLMAVAVLGGVALVSGCSDIQSSRNLADPNLSGQQLAVQVCSFCHGAEGNSSNAQFPRLAGQQPQYLTEQLKAFRSHGRSDPKATQYMWGIARSLTDNQITELASYYYGQIPTHGAPTDTALIEQGDKIFHNGIPETNVPPCFACHGADGHGHNNFPRIASQHANYIIKQLHVIKYTDERPQAAIMKGVAHGLDNEQIRAVATYLSGQS